MNENFEKEEELDGYAAEAAELAAIEEGKVTREGEGGTGDGSPGWIAAAACAKESAAEEEEGDEDEDE